MHVHQRQRPPISRRFQGFRERHLPLQLTLCPEMHQNDELKELTANHALADIEYDLLAQLLASFKDSVDGMSIEQKRPRFP